MAGISLLALLDDIASVLDDVALMTKVAARKTAGVLGDDLALNAQQVAGVRAERELPVVFSVAKGSLVNKAILIPAALLISVFAPWLIQPLLMLGGAYLCYEGAEKIIHALHKKEQAHGASSAKQPENSAEKPVDSDAAASMEISSAGRDASEAGARSTGKAVSSVESMKAFEKQKIKGAVRTDFVLSAEILVIALGTVPMESSIGVKAAVLVVIGLVMTVGVYGLVAGIVKMDDLGFALMKRNPEGGFGRTAGEALVAAAPRLMRILGIVGTIAMFTVGGGILAHGIPVYHVVSDALAGLPAAGLWNMLATAVVGVLAGLILAAVMSGISALRGKKNA